MSSNMKLNFLNWKTMHRFGNWLPVNDKICLWKTFCLYTTAKLSIKYGAKWSRSFLIKETQFLAHKSGDELNKCTCTLAGCMYNCSPQSSCRHLKGWLFTRTHSYRRFSQKQNSCSLLDQLAAFSRTVSLVPYFLSGPQLYVLYTAGAQSPWDRSYKRFFTLKQWLE
jgi:hypothetical protein